jgi:sporulation protein YlmC with PRC-barrel domain
MKMLHSLSMVAALGLAGTAYAQAANPDTTAPGTASSPHQRQATSTTSPESAPTGRTEPSAASSQHQRDATHVAEASPKTGKWDARMVGMKVQMSSGETLGEVKELLVDSKGTASYAIISHGGVMGVGAKRVAIPWANVQAWVQDDKLVMDRSQLEQAPVLSGTKTPDATSGTWSQDADAYWRTKVSTTRADAPAPIPAKERT